MKTAKAGDRISAMGITVTIKDILYQEYWYDRWDMREDWDIEFHDQNGNYRHWQSWTDGGEFIPAEEEA